MFFGLTTVRAMTEALKQQQDEADKAYRIVIDQFLRVKQERDDFHGYLEQVYRDLNSLRVDCENYRQALENCNVALERAGVGPGGGVTGWLDQIGKLQAQRDEARDELTQYKAPFMLLTPDGHITQLPTVTAIELKQIYRDKEAREADIRFLKWRVAQLLNEQLKRTERLFADVEVATTEGDVL